MPKKRFVQRHPVTQPSDTSYKIIPLTRKQNAKVDADVFDFLSQWNWQAHWDATGKTFYAVRTDRTVKPRREIKMHRLILGCSPKQEGDHINGDGLDNRRSNLRSASHAQNLQNRGKLRNNKTGFKGVCWHKKMKKYVAQIKFQKRVRYIGQFECAEIAAYAYDVEARKLHGEFAHTNFPTAPSNSSLQSA